MKSFRNRVRVNSTSNNEGGIPANRPPDALLLLDTSSSDVPTSFDPAIFEANTL